MKKKTLTKNNFYELNQTKATIKIKIHPLHIYALSHTTFMSFMAIYLLHRIRPRTIIDIKSPCLRHTIQIRQKIRQCFYLERLLERLRGDLKHMKKLLKNCNLR